MLECFVLSWGDFWSTPQNSLYPWRSWGKGRRIATPPALKFGASLRRNWSLLCSLGGTFGEPPRIAVALEFLVKELLYPHCWTCMCFLRVEISLRSNKQESQDRSHGQTKDAIPFQFLGKELAHPHVYCVIRTKHRQIKMIRSHLGSSCLPIITQEQPTCN